MEFKVLGPLDVVSGGRSLPLGGVKQRAVLGLLLLHANEVVATSRILDALWPGDARPVTARKMVQNAVWGLRTLLESEDGEGYESPRLLTRAPGYVLRVDPERLDATRFERAVAEGRARLDAGEPAEAAGLLAGALAEWRGPVLSDLAEQGLEWPESAALRRLRLDAVEDRFEAELACGRHRAVLGELASLAEAEPLRERLCGQLMLALYRCGRQAEALSVFGRVRHALVEEYGLEPSAALQTLQQRILRHDRALASPDGAATGPLRTSAGVRAASSYGDVGSGEQCFGAPEFGGDVGTGRRDVCVLVVCAQAAGGAAAVESEHPDTSPHDTLTALTESVETRSGTVVGSMGGLCAALFGLRSERPEASLNAVRAAFAARERLAARTGVAMRGVVISGRATVRRDPRDPRAAVPAVGALLDAAHGLLAGVPEGEVYVSEDVAGDTGTWVSYDGVGRPVDGAVGVRRARALRRGDPAMPGGDTWRHPELALLENLLEYSRHHDVPALLTVLGGHGAGGAELLTRFERRFADEGGGAGGVRVARPRGPKGGRDAADAAAALLDAWAPGQGVRLDPPEQRIRAVVRSAVHSDAVATRLLRVLAPTPPTPPSHPVVPGADLLAAWREVIEHETRRRPLVLFLDDLHLADEAVLDWAEGLAATGTGALLIVACGHSDLLRRRPFWGSGAEQAVRLTLPPRRDPVEA